ncbi:hypothetical protein [Notoacmeibacter sp. MSK16QG-6]|uniref:hypothetical protein n=1 Tax=Notoacmeibacter sp. MSK16QG-6 TaxID=2957982 RepID=UPI00209DF3CB|nr:hypothetical protein [Notoacmeibacter sp. MSK16QG-6]MCP1199665.1 hypothetical protein [Notoacmeibacter sp. MSK16QG-6]
MHDRDQTQSEKPTKKAGPLGLSKRTHAIIFVISVAIEIVLVVIFGASLWQGAQWLWGWMTGR